eukprot:COSAG02_NODE_7387_length_3038_cov_1.543042_3_plen_144_part_00
MVCQQNNNNVNHCELYFLAGSTRQGKLDARVCTDLMQLHSLAARGIGRYDPDNFAWGSGEAGWQTANNPDTGGPLDIVLSPDVWNHVVISADHHSKPPVINIWVQGQLIGAAPYPERALQCPPGTYLGMYELARPDNWWNTPH